MSTENFKKKAAQAALDYILPKLHPKMILGIGTGSTVNHFIDLLAPYKDQFNGAVSSSIATDKKLESHSIPIYDLNNVPEIPFYIDGADEATSHLHLIKGGGAALTREKIVAAVANEFICIVDKTKIVKTLGEFPVPIEVIPMARSYVARELVKLGGNPVYRAGTITDNNNIILDVWSMNIQNPVALETQINQITGVVTNGIFANRSADILFIANKDQIDILK